jgi:L-ascorbate metabolism protein UlaG (beta-lactamase superfamily)
MDPPEPRSGHAIARTEAQLVTMSHAHAGHSSLRSVGGEPVVLSGPGEYEVQEILVTGVPTFHDSEKGALRGVNTVFAVRLDDLVICHLGDLGHVLAAADLERIGGVDVCLLPVAGADVNLSAAMAVEIIHQLEPKVVVPMSYDPEGTRKDTPLQRMLHEIGIKELVPVPKLSLARSSLPSELQVIALDSRARV